MRSEQENWLPFWSQGWMWWFKLHKYLFSTCKYSLQNREKRVIAGKFCLVSYISNSIRITSFGSHNTKKELLLSSSHTVENQSEDRLNNQSMEIWLVPDHNWTGQSDSNPSFLATLQQCLSLSLTWGGWTSRAWVIQVGAGAITGQTQYQGTEGSDTDSEGSNSRACIGETASKASKWFSKMYELQVMAWQALCE